jgi:hypothetical protein
MPSRIFAQSSVLARVRFVELLFQGILLISCLVGTLSAVTPGGIPWQVGDVVVCYGGGNCNVLRIHGTSVQLLDTLSDGLLGNTGGVALNNSLHVVATDDKGGGSSKVVVYSIASINPFIGTPLSHNVISTFDASSGLSPSAAAIAVNSAGHIFVGNASASGASIVELNAHGAPIAGSVFTFPTTGACGTTTLGSLDISANADFIYVTAKDGVIRKVSLPLSSATCSQFANFGSGVTLYGIKDVPANALGGFCTGSVSCPAGESVLVVATGFTDPDALESGETASDAVNICTNQTDGNPVSCALLLNTSSTPGLTSPLWQAGTPYFTVGAAILDPYLHQQTVTSAGTSGADEPAFSQFGELTPVIDNAVIWTDKVQPLWAMNTPYTVTVLPNTPYIVDTNNNLETVTAAGTSGPTQPSWPVSGNTVDGLQWNDLGQLTRVANSPNPYSIGSLVSDPSTHAQQVIQAGETGSGALPAGGWNDSGGQTIEGVTWTESNPTWTKNTQFPVGTLIIDNSFHVQQVQQAGTSVNNNTQPNFNEGSTTDDNTVTWVDLGQAVWRPSFSYGLNAIIEDGNGHVQQVTTAGTSGPGPQPSFSTTPTTDGLQWQESGTVCGDSCNSPWTPGTQYTVGSAIDDNVGFIWNAISSGTSGTAANRPQFESNETPGTILADNAVVWTDEGLLSTSPTFRWQSSDAYLLNNEIIDSNQHVELVTVAGTSGFGILAPAFVDGGTVTDNGVTWADLGQAVWRTNFSYGLNAIIVDGSGNVEQVTTAGTTGSSMPSFSSSPTTDGSVVWTNQGPLAGSAFIWQAGYQYNLNAMVVDSNNHVELATNAGQSGPGPTPPIFVDGGSVIDGLIWADQGTPSWAANHSYAVAFTNPPVPGTYILDSNNHLETVTVPGISGPGTPPWPFNGGTTIDGLIWTDQNKWLPNHQYFTAGAVGDASGHVHTVLTTGTSGSGPSTPAGGWNDLGGTTVDNAVIWTESHPSWLLNHPYVTGNSDTLILDPNHHVQLVSTSGISGPTAPPFTSGHPASGQTIDGLQWSNQATPLTSVVARYPVTSVDTLQSLALDPLVANCTGNSCSSLPLPTRKTANFWMGDSVSGTFYKLDFATGAPITFTGGCATGCGIQSLVVYGGEGANQPGLASLVSNLTLNGGNFFTASAQFEQNSITSTLSNNGGGSPPATPISLYASLVDKTSCFNDPLVGNFACRGTVQADTSKAIVWKFDFPLNGTAGLPLTQTLNSSFGPPNVFGVDNSTDVFVDEQFDDTTFVGTDPGTRSISVHSLHEVPVTVPQGTAQCTYSSPLQNGIYKTNRGTLNFIFTCPGLTPTQFRNMHPTLSLVKKHPPQSPQFIPLSGTNGKGPYRFDSSSNFWTFQWNLNGATAGTYEGTTFDTTGVQSFTVTFSLK